MKIPALGRKLYWIYVAAFVVLKMPLLLAA
jgi:hypothetical protein